MLPVTAVLINLAGAASNAETLGVLILVTGIVVTQLNAVAMAVEYRLAHRVAVARLQTIFDRPTLALTGGPGRLKRTGRGRRFDSVAMGNPTDVSRPGRARLCERFGLITKDLNGKQGEDDHLSPDKVAAARAVRCLLRGASLVLVDDPDLLRNEALRTTFLDEIERRDTTLVMAPTGLAPVQGSRLIELGRPGRNAA